MHVTQTFTYILVYLSIKNYDFTLISPIPV